MSQAVCTIIAKNYLAHARVLARSFRQHNPDVRVFVLVVEDDALPSEMTFLQSGIFNLGFLGLSDTATTRRMLAWWQRRCAELCIVRVEDGLFVDQKWMDLVPVLFNDTTIVTDP